MKQKWRTAVQFLPLCRTVRFLQPQRAGVFRGFEGCSHFTPPSPRHPLTPPPPKPSLGPGPSRPVPGTPSPIPRFSDMHRVGFYVRVFCPPDADVAPTHLSIVSLCPHRCRQEERRQEENLCSKSISLQSINKYCQASFFRLL